MEKKQHRVKVVVRVRPSQDAEDSSWVRVLEDGKTLETTNWRNMEESLRYEFSNVYGEEASQEELYHSCVRDILTPLLHGQNSSVFAYGPTGAGKTHTMIGKEEDQGVIPRCVNGIFSLIQEQAQLPENSDWKFDVSFGYLEIYNEKVMDLLNTQNVDLPIRENKEKQIFVSGLTEKSIQNFEEFTALFQPASANRTTAATKLNIRSSRSHSVLLLKVKKTQKVAPFRKLHGKMYLIDLAGSEDNRRTGNVGVRLKESGAINSSLLALAQVVDALNKGLTGARIPYRNSKLTRLLQDSLGGNSHSCMIVNVAPEEQHYLNTASTLNFARKSKKIVNTTYTKETFGRPVLKRVINMDDESPEAKRPRTAPASPRRSASPPHMPLVDPAPFISPFLRRTKAAIEESMNGRLEALEARLMQQMVERVGSSSSNLNKSTLNSITQSMAGISKSVVSEVLGSHRQALKDLQQEHVKEKPRRVHSKSAKFITKSKENSPHSATENDSPLFVKPALFKKKKFRSTASIKKEEDSPQQEDKGACFVNIQKNEKDSSDWKIVLNPELQKKHDTDILSVLNSGSVKELQSLQKIGLKRAKLIHDWRQLHGPFNTVQGLEDIDGITKNFVTSFTKSNLMSKMSFA